MYILSSSSRRTIESAYANLAGLYPPSVDQSLTDELAWQPISVYVADKSNNFLVEPFAFESCPNYKKLLTEILTSSEVLKLNVKYKPLFKYLSDHLDGTPINGTDWVIGMLHDSLTIDKLRFNS